MRRLPSLDGVRAISIALVLLGHELDELTRHRLMDFGNLGVRCFFVLSGFLITALLLNEFRENGAISLRNFYARRTLRIFPAFYAFLLVVFVLERLGAVARISGSSWLHALTYTMDYQSVHDRPWVLGHLWSLAVEEQFYLLWPTVIVLLRPRRALWSALGVILLVPVLRFETWRLFPQHVNDMKWWFHTVCDSLATGCLLAGVRDVSPARDALARLARSRLFLLVPAGVLFLNWAIVGRPRWSYLVGQTGLNVGIAVCIDYVLRNSGGLAGRFLNLRVVAYVGTLSYSLYLWQQLFFDPRSTSWISRLPFNVLAGLTAAWLSYRLIEKPFLALRHRFAPPHPAGVDVGLPATPSET